MTNEQWLVYLWSIYPNGGFLHLWITLLVLFVAGIMFASIFHFNGYTEQKTLWTTLGKWKIVIPSILTNIFFSSSSCKKSEDKFSGITTLLAIFNLRYHQL